MKIKVTSNPSFVPGHADYLLRRLNAVNVRTCDDGTVEAEVDSETLRKFKILGGAHQVEVLEGT